MISSKLHEYDNRNTETTTKDITEIAKVKLAAARGTWHATTNMTFENVIVRE